MPKSKSHGETNLESNNKIQLLAQPIINMELEPDEVHGVDCLNGMTWVYMRDNKVLDTAFVTWKKLYYIQIGKA